MTGTQELVDGWYWVRVLGGEWEVEYLSDESAWMLDAPELEIGPRLTPPKGEDG